MVVMGGDHALGEVMLEGFGHQVVWMSTRERELK
jgi:hypothetical protein